ncbi:hypothetical protein SO078_16570 (plasmid) [Sinorhizobium meliloti]|uniref:hypothetical protein n=1 Tax=Rhizobium meliloti TaxID=382 RepID=UPI002D790C8A|nr:hypothetical protein [Sinorhizobium meliloti]WRQ70093.1 hypothetical protein SO078_16570 [Sinorhizobium meliloti]
MLYHHQQPDAIMPDGINFLDEVLTQLMTERGLGRDCEDAELVAVRLISLFQSGIRDRDMLRKMATPP